MNRIFLKLPMMALIAFSSLSVQAQKAKKFINTKSVSNIINILASDSMRGRLTFTPDMDRAAHFIASQFQEGGLQPMEGTDHYLQYFEMQTIDSDSAWGMLGADAVNSKSVFAVSSSDRLETTSKTKYKVLEANDMNELRNAMKIAQDTTQSSLIFVDPSLAQVFPRLKYLQSGFFPRNTSAIFVLGKKDTHFDIHIKNNISTKRAENVAAVIPGKQFPNEYVVFSSHYDHLGIDAKNAKEGGDSIYNGANDDASGTTAVMLLAKYFQKRNDNARTLIFVTFTGEELGGFGSHYFSQKMDPSKVVAMFNIEMIGTESKWGKNSAYITGFDKSNMGTLLQENLNKSKFHFYPDPYTKENLFYRSDNATLARQGVPAHTISTSKMDNEPNYHKVSDEVKTLDLPNMAEIIKSIAISSENIINGKQTPTRVETSTLK